MKKLSYALLLLTLLLGACSGGNAVAESVSSQKPTLTDVVANAPAGATESAAIGTPVPARQAVISEIENSVMVRLSAGAELTPASVGMSIGVGSDIETGEDGHVRIDLLPDGTIIRVGPNSSFTVPELVEENGEPKTTIELFFGKVYILLNDGSLDVKTPTGVASVRGSVLSVRQDRNSERLEASCLEGHCALENEDGEEVELVEGEESYVDVGEPPIEPEIIDSAEIEDWLEEVPEMSEFFEELPDPDDYPEPDAEDFIPGEDDGYPTDVPTDFPTDVPTDVPTEFPTEDPTEVPTEEPTEVPTELPTGSPIINSADAI